MLFKMLLLVVALLTVGTPIAAHEGHAHKTMGVVSMIHENHLEVTDLKNKKSTLRSVPGQRCCEAGRRSGLQRSRLASESS